MKRLIFVLFVVLTVFVSCNRSSQNRGKGPVSKVAHPEWIRNANIYEVNLRQFTNEGNISSFIKHLPRLRNMGVDVLWFMPIHPIGELKRKGALGSYYSVQDYKLVNSEFGVIEEFQMMVKLAHELGMYVIIDWVANHTAWDHEWVTKHPDWYAKNSSGEMYSPHDWTDVVQLDYSNQELRQAMLDAMAFWVREADIDGFRCDVADLVPLDFWEQAREELEEIKPLFMLAESDKEPLLINAFDMDYGWKLHHIANNIAIKEADANSIQRYFDGLENSFPKGAIRMNFTSNHDENSWNGTEFERLNDGAEAFFVLMATVPGMPLIYTGQEAALKKRLSFFDHAPVDWSDVPLTSFYRTLLNLKKRNSALWNGNWGAPLRRVFTNNDKAVYAFTRSMDNDAVMVILNLTESEQQVQFQSEDHIAEYVNVFTNQTLVMEKDMQMTLKPWEYIVLEKTEKK